MLRSHELYLKEAVQLARRPLPRPWEPRSLQGRSV